MDFFTHLESIVRSKGSCLCVGLDPRIDESHSDPESALFAANERVVEATAPYAAAFKPNLAFYEAFGPAGMRALERTLALIPGDAALILDAKRCDIDATAEAYARALFGRLGAGAVTLSPYMGRDTVEPFLKYKDRALFLLCRTSNPGALALQGLSVVSPESAIAAPSGDFGVGRARSNSEPLYIRVARECSSWSERVGLVVAGNDETALRAVREAAPRAWFLAPGIGAQGGRADAAFAAGAREDGLGILVAASRSLADAADPGAAARDLRDAMETARRRSARPLARGRISATDGATPASRVATPMGRDEIPSQDGIREGVSLKGRFFAALLETGCFRLGDFVLKSGAHSPFYIDLRRLVSDPGALGLAAEAYASIATALSYDRIAGIPAAALPLATAVSLRIRAPMLWPRMPVKEHGTGNRVEGAYERGERILLVDDLITTGASKLEAAQILRTEGLVVEDLVVLIERGRQGRVDMEAAGIRLGAFAQVRELFAHCEAAGLIDASRRRELEDYVDSE